MTGARRAAALVVVVLVAGVTAGALAGPAAANPAPTASPGAYAVSLTDGSGDATATWRVSQKDATTSWVNVSWAGAEPDRNLTVATDATAVALQRALDNVTATYDTVVVGDGRYNTTGFGRVTVHNDSVTLASASGDYRTSDAVVAGDHGITVDGDLSNVAVRGLEVRGMAAASGGGHIPLFPKGNTTDLTVTDNLFADVGHAAVFTYSSDVQTGLELRDNTVRDVRGTDVSGVQIQSATGGVVAGNTVENTTYAGMILSGLDGTDLKNNAVNDTPQKGIQLLGSSNLVVSGNALTNTSSAGASWEGALTVIDGSNLSVTGNTFADSARGLTTLNHQSTVTGLTVTGNQFSDNGVQVNDTAGVLDEAALLADNTFDRAVTVERTDGSVVSTVWSTVQAGEDEATTGDTVRVRAGTYVESVTVNTADVTLAGVGNATLSGGGSLALGLDVTANGVTVRGIDVVDYVGDALSDEGTSVRVTADGVTVEDARIASQNYGVFFEPAASGNVLRNVTVAGHGSHGVLFNEADRNRVLNSTLTNNGNAVTITDFEFSDGTADRNVVRNSSFSGSSNIAISVSDSSSGTLLVDNDLSGDGASIYASDAPNTTVRGNHIEGTYADIRFEGNSPNGTIVGNTLVDVFEGIRVGGSSHNTTIRDNVVDGSWSTTYGVSVSTDRNTIANNTLRSIDYRDGQAIELATSDGNLVTNNTVTGATVALDLSGSSNNRIVHNSFRSSTAGVRLSGATSNVTLRHNDVAGNTNGTVVGPNVHVATLTVVENDLSSNGNYALVNHNATALTATDNWWGSGDGPAHRNNTFNESTQGDDVLGPVDFAPWQTGPDGALFAPVTNAAGGQFAAIQAAVDASSAGGTVTATTGRYNESVTVDVAGLTLTESGEAVLDGGDRRAVGVAVTADDVTVREFTLTGYEDGVAATGAGAVLDDLVVRATGDAGGDAGVRIGAPNVTLTDSVLENNADYGIVAGGANATVRNNTVRASVIYGVLVTADDGVVANNTVESVEWNDGVRLNGASGTLVANNTVTGSPTHGVVLASGSSFTVVRDNVLRGNGNALRVESPSNVLRDNTAENNAKGVSVTGTTNVTVAGNALRSNGVGVSVTGASTDVTVRANVVADNTNGTVVGAAADAGTVVVTDNAFTGNAEYAVVNRDAAPLNATGNWWASADGPAHRTNTFNESSQGQAALGPMDVAPWLTGPDGATFAPVTTDAGGQFASMQAAVNASSGVTAPVVTATDGTYTERVTVDVADLTLTESGDAVLDGGGTLERGVDVTAANVTVADLRVQNYGQEAVALQAADGSAVRNVTVDGSPIGIGVRDSANASVSGVDVSNARRSGVLVAASANVTVRGGTVGAGGVGVHLVDATESVVTGVTLSTSGVLVESGGDNAVVGNALTGAGIRLESGANGTVVAGNRVEDADGAGVEVVATGEARVLNNTVTRSRTSAVRLEGADGAVVRNNTLGDAGAAGVLVESGTTAALRVVENEIRGSGGAAVRAVGVRNATVARNTLNGSAGPGLAAVGATDVTVRGNVVGDSGGVGVLLDDVNASLVAGNRVVSSGGDGVRASGGGADNVVRGNLVVGSGTAGIAVAGDEGDVVRNNTVRDSAEWGIVLRRSADATVAGNHLAGNDLGAGVVFSTGVTVTGNAVANGSLGVGVAASEGFAVRNNSLTDNGVGLSLGGPVTGTSVVADNRIHANAEYGVVANVTVADGASLALRSNVVTDNGDGTPPAGLPATAGVFVHDSTTVERVTLSRNVVTGNDGYGVYSANASAVLDATDNYWGGSRPSSVAATPVADPVTGALANGTGDAVSGDGNGTATVRFDPTLDVFANRSVTATDVDVNETVTVAVEVVNVAGARYAPAVTLSVDGNATAERHLALAPGETATVSFDLAFAESGSYAVAVNGYAVATVDAGTGFDRSDGDGTTGGDGGESDDSTTPTSTPEPTATVTATQTATPTGPTATLTATATATADATATDTAGPTAGTDTVTAGTETDAATAENGTDTGTRTGGTPTEGDGNGGTPGFGVVAALVAALAAALLLREE